MASLDDAILAGKGGPYPVVALFGDGGNRTRKWNYLLTDPGVYKELLNGAYVYIDPKRGGTPESKKVKVKRFPTLLIIHPRMNPPSVIETVTSGNAKKLAAMLQAASKKVNEPIKKKKEK